MKRKETVGLFGFYFLVAMAFVVFTSQPALAQNEGFKPYSLTVSSGDDPISSGITGIVQFTNEKDRLVEVAVQQEQAWFIYGQKFKKSSFSGTLGASIGHFQGAPWAGPILAMSMSVGKVAGREVSIRTLQWPGFFVWEPRSWKNDSVPNNEAVFLGLLTNVGMDIGPIGLTYSGLNFLNEPWNTLPGVSYTGSVRKDVSVSGSVTRNINKERWLFYVGLTWKPEKK